MTSEFERTWLDFLAAYEQGNDAAALERLNAWERVWDRSFVTGDWAGWDAVYHPEVELQNHTRFFDMPSGRGVERFKKAREEFSSFSSMFITVFDEIRRGEGASFAGLGSTRLRGRFSGIPMPMKGGAVWTLEGRIIRRVQFFTSHKAALRALDRAD